MRRRDVGTLLLAAAMTGLVACEDGTGPETPDVPRVAFTWADGAEYEAEGEPVFEGGDVAAEAFAIAFADSVGGLAITSFRETEGTRGDLFVLQITDLDEGEFGPCGTGGECHGRVLEDVDAANLADVGAFWEIVSGSVTLDEAGPERVTGSFTDLVLERVDGTAPDRTIESGTFDLPLLSDEEGVEIMECLLERATGGACETA